MHSDITVQKSTIKHIGAISTEPNKATHSYVSWRAQVDQKITLKSLQKRPYTLVTTEEMYLPPHPRDNKNDKTPIQTE